MARIQAVMILALAATWAPAQTVGERSETATVKAPFMIDNTDAMLARDRYFPPPRQVRVIPNLLHFRDEEEKGGDRQGEWMDPVEQIALGIYWAGPSESGGTPGDPNIAVGPNHVIVCINGAIRFYTKAGQQVYSVSPGAFFAGVAGVSVCCDCRCFYDPYAKRYFIMYLGFDATDHSYFEVAVSDDDNPVGTWAKWGLNSSMDGGTLSTFWSDYPGFGYTPDVLLFTGNMFPISGSGNYGKIRVAAKQQFLDGSPTITYTDFWNFTNPSGSRAFSLQPGRAIGASNVPVVVNVNGSTRLNVFAIANPLTNPTMVKKTLTVATFGGPAAGTQKGTTTKFDYLDSRVYDVNVRDNHIFATHNVSGGAGARLRWYEVDGSGLPSTMTLVQQGNIEDTTWFAGFGCLSQNQYGTVGTALTRASATEYISLYYTGREKSDAAGTMKNMTLKRAASVGYTGEGGTTVRWGDYCGGTVDAGDDFTFWAIGMVPTSAGAWGTEVFSFQIGQAATLSGTVELQAFTGDPKTQSAMLELRSPGTTQVLRSYAIKLDAASKYSLPAVALGTYDVAVKFGHWLRAVKAGVTTAKGANTVDFSLVNGDPNGDNRVDLIDINGILLSFETNSPSHDLNGDGVVDLYDAAITLLNFGLTGPD